MGRPFFAEDEDATEAGPTAGVLGAEDAAELEVPAPP